jgi:tetratricopeptide (TPR) repeat protein
MRTIFLCTLFFTALAGLFSHAKAQDEENIEKKGLMHLNAAFLKAIPQKNKAGAHAEFALAEIAFQKAIEKNPNSVSAYLHLGLTYSAQKKYTAAAETYRKALIIAPQRKEIYLRLASALEKNGDYRGAIKTLQELRALENDDRVIRIIDNFIGKMEKRAARTDPDNRQSGELP